ncbi:MAG: FMN-binding glutamate synthase family protein [Planctomycetota bacterium]
MIADLTQSKHSIMRNFPFLGRFRYIFERFGPPLRQYIVTGDLSERPFTRLQRTWVYRASKGQSDSMPFGTQIDQEAPGVIRFNPAAFPTPDLHAKSDMEPIVLGANRERPYDVKHIANVSSMSFGSLSKNAVKALSLGVGKCGAYMSTGEGGVSDYHLSGGGDLIFQIGPAKFGCRTEDGEFDEERFKKICESDQIKAIELKLAQGAKPGKGGVLPKEKISEEIARIRGIPLGKDCHSPNCHREFNDVDGLMNFVNRLRDLSGGRPVGFKVVLGGEDFMREVAEYIKKNDNGPDFITVDGAEGGTGAAPMSLSDHMGMSLQEALVITDNILREVGVRDKVKIMGSGRCITGAEVAIALGLGADLVQIARGYMFALGCIQALQCNENTCPTGVATQSKWLVRGLVPEDKAGRVAKYTTAIQKDVMIITRALGLNHPSQITRDHMSVIVEPGRRVSLKEIYPTTMKEFNKTRRLLKSDLS